MLDDQTATPQPTAIVCADEYPTDIRYQHRPRSAWLPVEEPLPATASSAITKKRPANKVHIPYSEMPPPVP